MPIRKTPSDHHGRKKKPIVKEGIHGIQSLQIPLEISSPEIATLAEKVHQVGGNVIGAYHDPFSGHPLLLASLPIDKVEPTPFQRDQSPAHTSKLAEMIQMTGSYLDPILAVPGTNSHFWSPNGGHRLAAAKLLELQQITTLISPDRELAFRILALNTEKAHNLKDRCLEVIRMARELAKEHANSNEDEFSQVFESPELLTLGILYERDKQFSGSAFRSILKKVDKFVSDKLIQSLVVREKYANKIEEIDTELKRIVSELEEKGFKSPYLRTYVVARIIV
jgi:ParB family chromosome partitioning protein